MYKKILHVCLANYYIDGYRYQENILPFEHKKMGFDVEILASTESILNNSTIGYVQAGRYNNEDGIPVNRINYKKIFTQKISAKIRIYTSFESYLFNFQPDVIFFHDLQFYNSKPFLKFKKIYPNSLFLADCHTDFINSAKNYKSYLMHRFLYKKYVKKIDSIISIHYGVLPRRCDFLIDFYGISRNKVDFLPLGGEDSNIEKFSSEASIAKVKSQMLIKDETVILTGGKINNSKREYVNFFKAFDQLVKSTDLNLKLIIFGSVDLEQKVDLDMMSNKNIIFVGWINSLESYKLMSISDIVIFPSHHSVYWEQAVAMNKPLIIKKSVGMSHIDFDGNIEYFIDESIEGYFKTLRETLDNNKINLMKIAARNADTDHFLYSNIAKKSLEKIAD